MNTPTLSFAGWRDRFSELLEPSGACEFVALVMATWSSGITTDEREAIVATRVPDPRLWHSISNVVGTDGQALRHDFPWAYPF